MVNPCFISAGATIYIYI